MTESEQTEHRTPDHETARDTLHSDTHKADINLLVISVRKAMAAIRLLIPDEELYNLEQILRALRELSRQEKKVNELKYVHNMLHDLETSLAVLDPLTFGFTISGGISNADRADAKQKKISSENWWIMKRHWMIAVVPKIQVIRYFAAEEMRFLDEPRLVDDSSALMGPSWILDLLALQEDFDKSLQEQNIEVIHELATEFLNICREHLLRIDRRLLEIINQLDELSDQILRSTDDDTTKPRCDP